jgi:hypothetical protein
MRGAVAAPLYFFVARIKQRHENEKILIRLLFLAIRCRNGKMVRTAVLRVNGLPWRSGAGRISSIFWKAAVGETMQVTARWKTSCMSSISSAAGSPRLPG